MGGYSLASPFALGATSVYGRVYSSVREGVLVTLL